MKLNVMIKITKKIYYFEKYKQIYYSSGKFDFQNSLLTLYHLFYYKNNKIKNSMQF